MRKGCRESRRGFTLVELVVVVVILAIAASVIMPRMFDRTRRDAEQSARSLSELVSALGTRATLGGQRLALRYDSRSNRLVPESWAFRGSPGDFSAEGEWVGDPILASVTLEGLEIRSINVDGQALSPDSWRIESRMGAPAPVVSIGAGPPKSSTGWSIELAPGSLRASMRPMDAPPTAANIVDLDAQGLDKEAW